MIQFISFVMSSICQSFMTPFQLFFAKQFSRFGYVLLLSYFFKYYGNSLLMHTHWFLFSLKVSHVLVLFSTMQYLTNN